MPEMTPEEAEALEGLFFNEHDIRLYLDGNSSAKELAFHLNSYILQGYRIGAAQ